MKLNLNMDKKKILFINNNLVGFVYFRMDVMEHLQEDGYEVVAVAPSSDKGIAELGNIRVEYVPFDRTSTNPLHDLRYLRQLVKLFKKERPDYAFMYTIKPNIYGTLAARWCGVHSSMMMAGLGYTFTNNRMSSRIARGLYRLALRFTDKLLLLNEDNVKTIRNMGMCPQEKIVFLEGGEGVNLSHYTYTSNKSDKIIFLFVGRLLKEKGIFDFVEAAKIVKKEYPEAEFHIAGGLDREFPNSLKQNELDELVKSGIVSYLGQINMVEKLKEPGIVIIIPSYYSEGLNRSLMEGCATGKPIITTNQPGCAEALTDGKNGYMIPVCQPQKLAEAIMKYIKLSDVEKMRMSEESRKLAEQKFDVKHVIKTYESILCEANLKPVDARFDER